ncbi:hypothetical protein [Facklamia miroungae]|uniref:SprT-like family protein n=1 Tax=Facklamia miroungae TaxID=120956 RepID=A0A1G7QFU6_9LACT|nr:hypothetical protein [Facklamia miroungae]NKZ28927.1 hypothetical protein [Facklamia miroungae]SDF97427.1 hypothetical protein SAMN05421791_10276 [Facklamia miroungae]
MNPIALEPLLEKWTQKLRISPEWSVRLELVDDSNFKKTGDIKIDCTDKKAVLLLNVHNPMDEKNIEEIIVHELMHLKMYPLDQVTESLIKSNFEVGSAGYNFAYRTFFENLEVTVEELAKCFLLEYGENKEISFGRCNNLPTFNDLFKGLDNLE